MKFQIIIVLLISGCLLMMINSKSPHVTGKNADKVTPFSSTVDEQFKLDSSEIIANTIISGLDVPWEIAWGPDNWIWVTEQDGIISKVNPETGEKKLLVKIPDVYRKRLGLLSMALHPDMQNFPFVFFNYTHLKDGEIISKLVRYTYNGKTLDNPEVLLEWPGLTGHNGSRIAIAPDGKLMVATGDAFIPRKDQDANLLNGSQKSNSLNGKILRLNIDGTIPKDNPISGTAIWARGFRVPQGLVYASNGNLYSAEHGHSTDDEINIIQKGGNYGWPNVAGFCDLPEEKDFCSTHAVIQPLKAWTPTIAPAGIDYYDSGAIPEWENSILMVTLKTQSLRVLNLDSTGTSVISENVYFDQAFGRLRDLCVSPDGDVYISTSNRDWNPVDGFPKENDDSIIKISTSKKNKPLENSRKTRLSIIKPSSKAGQAKISGDGGNIYDNYCNSCHKNDGNGLPGLSPPLKGSQQILGDKEELIRIVLQGFSAPVHKKEAKYDQEMPAFSFLNDQEIAEVLTYIRTNFGNNASTIVPQEVTEVRELMNP